MKFITKIVRYLLFIPLCFFAIKLIYFLFGLLLAWFVGLNIFWIIVLFLISGSVVWGLFKYVSYIIIYLSSLLSPNANFAFWTITSISVINGILDVVNLRSDIEFRERVAFVQILAVLLIIELTYALISGAAINKE